MAMTRVAILIDAENVPATHAAQLFCALGKYGTISTRRAYADFAKGMGTTWLTAASLHAINTVQVCSPAKGKNSSDIRLTIDAIELLADDRADIFCLCSSDGDFTPLARHIRGAGKRVVGVGNKTASASFRQSCDTFIVLDDVPNPQTAGIAAAVAKSAAAKVIPKPVSLLTLVGSAIKTSSTREHGWLAVQQLGQVLRRLQPTFDRKTYGTGTLSAILRKEPALEVLVRNGETCVRLKPKIVVLRQSALSLAGN